jgi:hypothetical protein
VVLAPGRKMTACESNGESVNLRSSGTVSARPIGVNVPINSPQATADANQATIFGLRSTAQKAAIALIKISAFVGAAISQNILET